MRCSVCGDSKPLGPDGTCLWRSGCEHRQMQTRVAADRFDAEYAEWFEPLGCGHTGAEHAEMIENASGPQIRRFDPPGWVVEFLRYYEETGPFDIGDLP